MSQQQTNNSTSKTSTIDDRRTSHEEAMAIKAEVDYQRLNKSFTDVTFIVGPPQHSKKYVGHRVLLAMTSPVFETMFYGDMADKSKYIRIPDVAPIGFENLLRYAYTDSLNLCSVEDSMLTAYAAKKYLLPQLLRECLTYIEHNISPQTACVVFEFAHVLNSQQLVLQAMNLIDRQTNSVIASKTFSHVQASTVEFVANRRYLTLESEYSLFCAVINWSISEAKRRVISPDDWTSIRSILNESLVFKAFRFLAMKPDELARAIIRTSGSQDGMAASSSTTTRHSAESEELNGSSGLHAEAGELDVDSTSSLLTISEQRALFLNLALPGSAKLPDSLNRAGDSREPPPEFFTLRRFRSSSPTSGQSNLITTTTNTRSMKLVSTKFQCLSENLFIVALTIPMRLDISASYVSRTPKFECHLKFTTKTTPASVAAHPELTGLAAVAATSPIHQDTVDGSPLDSSILLMDTIDESLNISISRDKDCLAKLKRPILIRKGNINEITITFQTYALDEDIVALKTPKARAANFSEQTDDENISWLFFKTPNIEFSELHYYY